jgi:predicted lipid-binding transport protein (Tim44 family)
LRINVSPVFKDTMTSTFKSLCLALSLSLAALSLSGLPLTAEAKRLGGGKPAGMQRQLPPAAPATAPAPAGQQAARPATPATTPPLAAAAPAKRSWLGPIAGLAAGLGLAALASHFGMGEAMGNLLTFALLAIVAVVAVRWLVGRFRGAGPQLAGAGAPYAGPTPMARGMLPEAGATAPAASAAQASTATGSALPGFDAEAFERIAKMIFVRLQAANDAGDVEDLRKFTTPELFASLRLDLQERGATRQQTDVVQLTARVVDTALEGHQQVASVRFDGLIREELNGPAAPFDEVWHLVRPADGSREWAIAGIAPIN